MITSLIGWVGVILIVMCNFPQLKDTLKYGRHVRVNKHTYTLLLLGIFCHLIRAVAIMEPVFIVSHVISFVCIALIRSKLE